VQDLRRKDHAGRAEGPLALVVLGCRVSLDGQGRLRGALRRRVDAAASAFARRTQAEAVIVASGGRRWAELVEADAIARELVRLGVPEKAIVRERCSLSTRENARFAMQALARRGIRRATVVTCAWHLPRALRLFEQEGVEAQGLGAEAERAPLRRRLWRWGRERVLTWAQVPRA